MNVVVLRVLVSSMALYHPWRDSRFPTDTLLTEILSLAGPVVRLYKVMICWNTFKEQNEDALFLRVSRLRPVQTDTLNPLNTNVKPYIKQPLRETAFPPRLLLRRGVCHLPIKERMIDMSACKAIRGIRIRQLNIDVLWQTKILIHAPISKVYTQRLGLVLEVADLGWVYNFGILF